MKLNIKRSDDYTETLIDVCCLPNADLATERMLQKIRNFSNELTGIKNGSIYKILLEDILYIECVDDRTFIYTSDETYECAKKIYQLEGLLQDTDFVRSSKSVILNTSQLESVRSLLNSKLEVTLLNGEKLLINRHYVSAFKGKFGV